jgi:hypothetical protein
MIRVSTTALEQYRRLVEYEYVDEAELIAQVKGDPFATTWQMRAGTAWDAYLSRPTADFDADFTFDLEAIHKAKVHVGDGIWQVKHTRAFDTPFGEATVVGVADHIRGLLVTDVKAKFSKMDAREYEPSLQWRLYLLIFGAAAFRYCLFDFREPKDGYCELTDMLSFRFWPYAQMEADCNRWLADFLAWADQRDLIRFLNRESSTPIAA